MYYYGARYYAPWLCRFVSVDPLAGKYVFQSAYTYADNNPVNYNDPTGMGSEPVNQTAQTDNNNQRAESKNSEVGTSSNGPPEKTLWRKIRLFVDNIFGDGKIFIKSDEGPKIPMYKHTIKLERNNTIDLGHGMGGQLGRYTGKQTETSSSTPPQRMNDPVMVEPRFLTKLPSPELTPPTLQPINTNIIRQRPSNFTPPNPRTIPGVNYADSTPTDRQINASRIAGRDLSRNPNYRVAIQAVLYFNAVNPNNASEVSTALNKPSVESNSKSPSFRAFGLNQSNAMRRIMISNGASNSQVIVLQPSITNNIMNSGIRITFIRTP